MTASGVHVVLGANGPVGLELIRQLAPLGVAIRAASRSGRAEVPEGVEVVAADAREVDQVIRICEGASVLYFCVGMPYPEWAENFPRAIRGAIEGAESSGARLVFADNLYCYGPVVGRLTEELPGTRYGKKPALRAQLAERELQAHT